MHPPATQTAAVNPMSQHAVVRERNALIHLCDICLSLLPIPIVYYAHVTYLAANIKNKNESR